jgi:hypothetical protein
LEGVPNAQGYEVGLLNPADNLRYHQFHDWDPDESGDPFYDSSFPVVDPPPRRLSSHSSRPHGFQRQPHSEARQSKSRPYRCAPRRRRGSPTAAVESATPMIPSNETYPRSRQNEGRPLNVITHSQGAGGHPTSPSSSSSAIAGALGDGYPLLLPPCPPMQLTSYSRAEHFGMSRDTHSIPTFDGGGLGSGYESSPVLATGSPDVFGAGSWTPSGSAASSGSRNSHTSCNIPQSSGPLQPPTCYTANQPSSYQQHTHDTVWDWNSQFIPYNYVPPSSYPPPGSSVANPFRWNSSSTVGLPNISLPGVGEQRKNEYGPPLDFGTLPY